MIRCALFELKQVGVVMTTQAKRKDKKHDHSTHVIVKDILKQIAKSKDANYHHVIARFKEGDSFIAHLFWKKLNESNETSAYSYNKVGFCMTCKKFMLYWQTQEAMQEVVERRKAYQLNS